MVIAKRKHFGLRAGGKSPSDLKMSRLQKPVRKRVCRESHEVFSEHDLDSDSVSEGAPAFENFHHSSTIGTVDFDDCSATAVSRSKKDVSGFCQFTGTTFDKLSQNFNKYLLRQLENEGYSQPTMIQRDAVPLVLKGCDVLIRSSTGSGKTLAFALPAIQILLNLDAASSSALERKNGSYVLVLAPTRELVVQTVALATRLTIPFPQIVVAALTGGEKRKSEKARLRKGVTFLCATIGRICDHLDTTSSFMICNLSLLILDEADRLLDMGFEKKIRWIINKLRELKSTQLETDKLKRISILGNGEEDKIPGIVSATEASLTRLQAILVSATLSKEVEQLAKYFLNSQAVWVGEKDFDDAGSEDTVLRVTKNQKIINNIPTTLNQYFVEYSLKSRLALLFAIILEKAKNSKVVVFVSNCESAEFHHAIFQAACWPNHKMFESKRSSNQITILSSKLKTHQVMLKKRSNQYEYESSEESDSDASDQLLKFDDKEATMRKRKKIEPFLGQQIGRDIKAFMLHGSLPQSDRIGYLNDFNKSSSGAVLFTTDVASRGLNFCGVEWIVQVDPPQEIQEFVHRVGRTARLGRQGNALLMVQEHEMGYIEYLRNLGVSIQPIPEIQLVQPLVQTFLPEELKAARLQNLPAYLTSFLCRQVESDLDLLHRARRTFSSSFRSYRCYSKELKQFFSTEKLHLGHLASAFGLIESPSTIGEKCRLGVFAAAARTYSKGKQENKTKAKSKALVAKNAIAKPVYHQDLRNVAAGALHEEKKHLVVPKAAMKRLETRKGCIKPSILHLRNTPHKNRVVKHITQLKGNAKISALTKKTDYTTNAPQTNVTSQDKSSSQRNNVVDQALDILRKNRTSSVKKKTPKM